MIVIGTKWRAIGLFQLGDTKTGVLKAHPVIYRMKFKMLQVQFY